MDEGHFRDGADPDSRATPTQGFPGTPAVPLRPMPLAPDEEESDFEIVKRILDGEQEAFRLLIERHQRRVFNLALRYLRGDRGLAADAAQDIFLKIFRGLSGFQENAQFSTWIHRVAVNHLISEIRKQTALKRGRPISLDAPWSRDGEGDHYDHVGDRTEEPTRRLLNTEKGKAILHAIGDLDPDSRSLVVLRDMEEKSYEEIAAMLSVPIGTVRSRLHRARAVLREKLKGRI